MPPDNRILGMGLSARERIVESGPHKSTSHVACCGALSFVSVVCVWGGGCCYGLLCCSVL